MNTLLKGGLVAMVVLSFGANALAFDHHGKKKKNMKDPMARAEMQCEKAKKAAEEGADEDEKSAEEKCAMAMKKAKEKAEKMAMKADKKAKGKKEKDDDDSR